MFDLDKRISEEMLADAQRKIAADHTIKQNKEIAELKAANKTAPDKIEQLTQYVNRLVISENNGWFKFRLEQEKLKKTVCGHEEAKKEIERINNELR